MDAFCGLVVGADGMPVMPAWNSQRCLPTFLVAYSWEACLCSVLASISTPMQWGGPVWHFVAVEVKVLLCLCSMPWRPCSTAAFIVALFPCSFYRRFPLEPPVPLAFCRWRLYPGGAGVWVAHWLCDCSLGEWLFLFWGLEEVVPCWWHCYWWAVSTLVTAGMVSVAHALLLAYSTFHYESNTVSVWYILMLCNIYSIDCSIYDVHSTCCMYSYSY